jgi:hypothetical protein
MASDGKWYPPELHPSRAVAPGVYPSTPADFGPSYALPLSADEVDGTRVRSLPPTAAAIPASSIVVASEPRDPAPVPGALPPFSPYAYVGAPTESGPLPPVVPPFGQPPAAANTSPSTGFVQQSVWAVSGHGTSAPPAAGPGDPWAVPGQWHQRQVGRARPGRGRRAPIDVRGVLSALASLIVLICALQPWYQVRVIGPPTAAVPLDKVYHYSLFATPYGGWRVLLPLVAAFAVLIGIFDSVLRSGDRGAVGVLLSLQLLTVAELALVIGSVALRTPALPLHLGLPQTVETVVEVTVVAWVALGASVVAVFSTMASSAVDINS